MSGAYSGSSDDVDLRQSVIDQLGLEGKLNNPREFKIDIAYNQDGSRKYVAFSFHRSHDREGFTTGQINILKPMAADAPDEIIFETWLYKKTMDRAVPSECNGVLTPGRGITYSAHCALR